MPQRGPSRQRNLRNRHTNKLSRGHAVTRQAGTRLGKSGPPLLHKVWVGGSLKLWSVDDVVVVRVHEQHIILHPFRASSPSSDVQRHVQALFVLTDLHSQQTS